MANNNPVVTQLTPNFKDILVTETRVNVRANSKERRLNAPHPNSSLYPHHRLAWIEVLDKEKKIEEWYWVAEYSEQHNYNYEINQIGTHRWPICTQTWMIPREKFTGVDMPVKPPPSKGNVWVRIGAEQSRNQAKFLDSIFVVLVVQWQDHSREIRDYDVDPNTGIVTSKITTYVQGDDAPTDGQSKQTYVGAGWSLRETKSPDEDGIENYFRAFPDKVNIQLPNILTSITAVMNEGTGNAEAESSTDGLVVGDPYNLDVNDPSSAQSSASVSPDLLFEIESPDGSNIPCVRYIFYVPKDTIQESDILAKLSSFIGQTVNAWPRFKTKSLNFICKGMKVSVRASTSANSSVYYNSNGPRYSQMKIEGKSRDIDISTSVRSITIPPTIHGGLSVTGETTKLINVEATAHSVIIGVGNPVDLPDISNELTVQHQLNASITPTSISATNPPSIPNSGLYMVNFTHQIFDKDWTLISAVVIDASDI